MAQAVSYQPLTRETKVQSQASTCGTCGTTAGIYPNTVGSWFKMGVHSRIFGYRSDCRKTSTI